MMWWRRVRAAGWAAGAVGVTAAGLVLAITGATVAAMTTKSSTLSRLSDQSQILGVGLTAVGLAVSVGMWLVRRMRGEPVPPPSAEELLRRRVASREDETRRALLDGLISVDLGYDTARGPAGPDAGPAPGWGLLARRVFNSLLRYETSAEPLTGTRPSADDHDLRNIGAYVAGLEHHRLVVLGRPGSGKTILAIELVLQLLQIAERDPDRLGRRVPVRLGAASWLPGQKLTEWMLQRLVLDYGLSPAAAAELIDARRVLPILDGLDEMDPEPTGDAEPERALALLRELNAFSDLGRSAPVVVTCRNARYEQIMAAGGSLQTDDVITIRDLDAPRLRAYVHARYPAGTDVRANWEKVLNELHHPKLDAARAILATPWRLLLAVAAIDDGQDPRRLLAPGIGETAADAEQRIGGELLASYISSAVRQTARRGRRDRHYTPAQVERWMRTIAEHLAWQAEQAKTLDQPPAGMTAVDIVPHLLWPIAGPRLIRRLHSTIGLTAGALAAVIISYIVVGPPATWIRNVKFYFDGRYPTGIAISNTITILALFAGIPWLITRWSNTPWPTPQMQTRRRERLGTKRLQDALLIGLAAIVSLTPVIVIAPVAHVSRSSAAILFGLVAVGFVIAGVSLGISEQPWLPDARMPSHMHAIRNARNQAFATGLSSGLVVALATAIPTIILLGVSRGIVAGIFSGSIAFMDQAGPWIRYLLGHALAVVRRRLPARLDEFLAWACDAGLLRVAGATYQFRHLQLQEWLHPSAPAEVSGRRLEGP